MADLAKLVVRLEAQSAQLLTELEKANRRIDRFASQTSKTLSKWSSGLLGYFSAKALIGFGDQVLNNVDKLGDFSKQAGLSAEEMSSLGYAAGQSGSDIESLSTSLNKLSKSAVAAAGGNKQATASFKAMDISAQKADGSIKDTDDLLLEIADSFSQHADGAEKSALAQQLFGKSGAELIPFLNKGAAGIKELTARADALGITISTQTQQAADDLNDTLATMGAVVQGVAARAIGVAAPIFIRFAEAQLKTAEASGELDKSSRVLATGLQLLLSTGVIVSEVFDRVGDTLGAVAAAVVAAATGNFSEAADILNDLDEKTAESGQAMADSLKAIWAEAGENVVAAAKDTETKLGKVKFGLPSEQLDTDEIEKHFKKLNDLTETDREKALRSVDEQIAALDELSAKRRITDEQYAARLADINKSRDDALGIGEKELQATETQQEQAVRAIDAQVAALDRLSAARKITDEQYVERMKEINKARNDALGITKLETEAEERRQKLFSEGQAVFDATRTPLEQYEQTLVKLNLLLQQGAIDHETYGRAVADAQDELDKANGKMTDFAEQMRKNVQDILGEGLANAFKGSARDILDTFYDMINKMVAQALAAQIGEKLFGDASTAGKGGIGGYIGKGLDFLGSIFGGKGPSRDAGGRGSPGMAYAIGTGAQPEVYVPDQPGTFYPAGGMGRSSTVNQNIYFQGRADQRSIRQMELETARRQRIANARLG